MTERVTAWCTPALLFTVTIVGLCTPGHLATRDTISSLGAPGEPYAWLVCGAFVVYGAAVAWSAAEAGRTLVVAYGIAAVITGVAPKGEPGLSSDVHVAATLVGGAAIVTAMVIDRAPVLAASAAAAAVAFRFAWGTPVYGVLERAMLVLVAIWLLQTSAGSRRSSPVSSSSTRRQPHSSARSGSPSDGPDAMSSSLACNRNWPRGR